MYGCIEVWQKRRLDDWMNRGLEDWQRSELAFSSRISRMSEKRGHLLLKTDRLCSTSENFAFREELAAAEF